MAETIISSSLTSPIHRRTVTESIDISSRAPPRSTFPCPTKNTEVRSLHRCELALVRVLKKGVDSNPGLVSPGECVRKLYDCINEKNAKESRKIIAEDCCFEDFAFTKPFNGKKEVAEFLEQVGASMGKNVKFYLKEVHEEGDAAWASWHLEWKGTEIPFTKGCSNFQFLKKGDNVLIKKAQVYIESPIKPGGLVLILLKAIASLFDEFPKATESFLKSPQVAIQFVQHIYLMFLAPFIKPLLESYINLGKFIVRVASYVLTMLIVVLKLIFN